MSKMKLGIVTIFATLLCISSGDLKGEQKQPKKPGLVGMHLGKPLKASFAEDHPFFLGYFSQHHLRLLDFGSCHTRMAGSIYFGDEDSSIIREQNTASKDSLQANLAKLSYWLGFCSANPREAGICGSLGLSLFTWAPIEAANSYYGVSGKVYYKSGFFDLGQKVEIQTGFDYESFIGDGVRLSLNHFFIGVGMEVAK